MNKTMLSCKAICKSYRDGTHVTPVLHEVSLDVASHQMVAIVGSSGSGKSTLLHIVGTLDQPDSGELWLAGKQVSSLSSAEKAQLRNEQLGFIYQFHHLLPEFSALENVMMPMLISGIKNSDAEKEALKLLDELGLKSRKNHRPAQLSGGEQQRVAILRAIAAKPKLILADEPTGNLDPHNSELVFDILYSLVKSKGIAAIIATHNLELAKKMDSVLALGTQPQV